MRITPRQLDVLKAIDRLTEPRGPTIRELGEALGLLSSCTTFSHVRALQSKGLILGEPGKARGIRLTWAGIEALKTEEGRE